MANPIMQRLNQSQSNPQNFIAQLAEFKKQMQGKNPYAILDNMIASGQISATQVEQFKAQAQSLLSLMK